MKTINTPKNANFNNLKNAATKEIQKRCSETLNTLNEFSTIENILDNWHMTQYLTPATRTKTWLNVDELKNYITKRINKSYEAQIVTKTERIETVLNSGILLECTVNVEWKKSQMWGTNPTADARFIWLDSQGNKRYDNASSGSISGCGYDKESTAIANVLNQINPILKSLYTEKNKTKNVGLKNDAIFGYGSGYGILPSIEGGVGVSCYPEIFNKIGYTFKKLSSGKTFDVYQITKN